MTYAGTYRALLVGISFYKKLSYAKYSHVPVHHIKGHMYANFLEHDVKLYVSLVVSGHTNIIYIDEEHNFINIGETLDDAVGESCG